MNVLMVAPICPWPATSGEKVRIANILREMSRRWQVTFVAPVTISPDGHVATAPPDLEAKVLLSETVPSPVRSLRGVLSLAPYHCAFFASSVVIDCVRSQIREQKFDLVYCHLLHALHYLPDMLSIPVVFDQQNVDRIYWKRKTASSRGVRKLVSLWNLWKVVRYETQKLGDIWAYVSVCDQDRARTRDYAKRQVAHYFVAENGVDTRKFTPRWSVATPSSTVTLGFLGSLDMDFNRSAAEHLAFKLLPQICASEPSIEFQLLLIGRNPSRRLIVLAQQDRRVTVTGAVDSVVDWLQQCDIFVAPLRDGAGTKLKTIEALACGRPVVGTEIALAGLAGQHGRHYLRVDKDDELVRLVCHLAQHPGLRAEIGQSARRLAMDSDWTRIVGHLCEEVENALSSPGSGDSSCRPHQPEMGAVRGEAVPIPLQQPRRWTF